MGALAGLLGSRALAWAVLGGGGLVIAITLYQGIKSRGGSIENAAWQAVMGEKKKVDRDRNFRVDSTTNSEGGTLEREINDINRRWSTTVKKDDAK
jgi:hypothetical protein